MQVGTNVWLGHTRVSPNPYTVNVTRHYHVLSPGNIPTTEIPSTEKVAVGTLLAIKKTTCTIERKAVETHTLYAAIPVDVE